MNFVTYNDEIIEYSFARKNVKNINLRIRADGSVAVSAPRGVPLSAIESFVLLNAPKILSVRRRIKENENRKIKFENGDGIFILGKRYELSVRQSGKNKYAVKENSVIFYLCDFSYDNRVALYDKLLSDTAKREFEGIVAECLPLFPQKISNPPKLKIRRMKSQWGNCRALKNVVTLNSRLAAYDRDIIKFVVCHEFCHFSHQNHSKAFYDSLSRVMPKWKEYDKVLNNKLNYC